MQRPLLSIAVLLSFVACKAGEDSGSAGQGGGGGSAGAGGAAANGGAGGSAGSGGGSGGSGGAAGAGGSTTGAGGAAAGAGGAGGVGGGGAGNPCSTRPGLLYCDDFEGGALSTSWTTQLNGGGTVTVDGTTPAHSGTKSVHVNGTGYDTLFALHDPTVLPVSGGRFYARAYMRLGAAMTGGHNTFIIADMFAMPGAGNNVRVGEMNAMLMETVMGDSHGALSNNNYYNDQKPGVVFAPGTWVCVELLLDHAKPEIDVWVDGAEVPDLHHTDWPLDSYDTLRLGFEAYAGPASEVWYDDVAVGTERIGCN
jgi:hypothetical protein